MAQVFLTYKELEEQLDFARQQGVRRALNATISELKAFIENAELPEFKEELFVAGIKASITTLNALTVQDVEG
jgi:hypothetical protein